MTSAQTTVTQWIATIRSSININPTLTERLHSVFLLFLCISNVLSAQFLRRSKPMREFGAFHPAFDTHFGYCSYIRPHTVFAPAAKRSFFVTLCLLYCTRAEDLTLIGYLLYCFSLSLS